MEIPAQDPRRLAHGEHNGGVPPEGEPYREIPQHKSVSKFLTSPELCKIVLPLRFVIAADVQVREKRPVLRLVQLMDTGGEHTVGSSVPGNSFQITSIPFHGALPQRPLRTSGLGAAEELQGLYELVLPGLMIKVYNPPAALVPIEKSLERQPGPALLLAGNQLFAVLPGGLGILLSGGCLIEPACRPCNDRVVLGKTAVIGVLVHMKRLHAGFSEFVPGKVEVLLGGFQSAPGRAIVITLQHMGGVGLNTSEQEILKRMVMNPGSNVIEIAYKSVCVSGGPGAGCAVPVPETGAENEVQPPLGLLHQARI